VRLDEHYKQQLRLKVERPPFEKAFLAAVEGLGERDTAARKRGANSNNNSSTSSSKKGNSSAYSYSSSNKAAAASNTAAVSTKTVYTPAMIKLLDEVPHDRALVYRSIWGFLGG
jgi:hypothetical protein